MDCSSNFGWIGMQMTAVVHISCERKLWMNRSQYWCAFLLGFTFCGKGVSAPLSSTSLHGSVYQILSDWKYYFYPNIANAECLFRTFTSPCVCVTIWTTKRKGKQNFNDKNLKVFIKVKHCAFLTPNLFFPGWRFSGFELSS